MGVWECREGARVATAGAHLGGSSGRRRNQSVESVVVGRAEVGASRDEFAHDLGVADDRGVHERGDAVRVALVHLLREERGNGEAWEVVPWTPLPVWRSSSPLVHLGARLEDDVQHGQRPVGRRRHQRGHRRLVVVESVDGLTRLLCQHQQHPHLRVEVCMEV